MNRSDPRHRLLVVSTTAALVGLTLTGCAAPHSDAAPHPAVTRTASATQTTATRTPSRPPATPSAAPSAAGAPSAPAANAASTPAPGAGAAAGPGTRSGMCTTAQLSARLGEQGGNPPGSGGGMSKEQLAIILTNTSPTTCTLQGWPGVSYVGDGNGTQIGPAATPDRDVQHPTVTLQPGRAAQAYIIIEVAAAFDPATCKPVHIDGIRVYPPGSRTALFIRGGSGAGDGTACSAGELRQTIVEAVIPYP
ncbi:DUF4232 domain-containing protein [Curtobacterium sp. MCBD17_040]|uniref:DUF4232 domain-containing protein n=1 Tax=Curtobacterium sp. MCBD17_040 TaxID=2175674 RepID=UPI000DAA08D4|nr:DUF4232 domain-containing protein [Curtobacterium sp. MCBD17_040]WIB63043.1 DUF4232 domain-containing protein [Curtobacterium sp. MCBD17_040]